VGKSRVLCVLFDSQRSHSRQPLRRRCILPPLTQPSSRTSHSSDARDLPPSHVLTQFPRPRLTTAYAQKKGLSRDGRDSSETATEIEQKSSSPGAPSVMGASPSGNVPVSRPKLPAVPKDIPQPAAAAKGTATTPSRSPCPRTPQGTSAAKEPRSSLGRYRRASISVPVDSSGVSSSCPSHCNCIRHTQRTHSPLAFPL
jgi:hypothetical protein